MALIIEDGTGLEDALAYVDTAYVIAFWTPRNVDLSAVETAVLEAAIIQATETIDSLYAPVFRGTKASGSQALQFPRSGAEYDDGSTIAGVPNEVKRSTALLTNRALSGDLIPDRSVLDEGRPVKKLTQKLEDLSTSVEYADRGTESPVDQYPKATGILRPVLWLDDGSSGSRSGGFGYTNPTNTPAVVAGMFGYPK